MPNRVRSPQLRAQVGDSRRAGVKVGGVAAPLFSALLKYWPGRRGYSQLDFSLEADVSARHLSFLESGRAEPSEEMVLQLMAALDVPLREQNQMLRAAGFDARFPEPELSALAPAVEQAIARMMQQQEPYPLTVLSVESDILRSNKSAQAIFEAFIAEPAQLPSVLNMFSLMFDPRFIRPFVVDWENVARGMLSRLQRESLQRRGDARLSALLDRIYAYPGVPREWRQPDFSTQSEATLTLWFRRAELTVGFFTTLTVFSAPQQVTLEELRIESCFPLDDETRRTCERLAVGS